MYLLALYGHRSAFLFNVSRIPRRFSPDRRRGFLFYVELASAGYSSIGGYLIINLLSSARLRAFLLYVELAFPA